MTYKLSGKDFNNQDLRYIIRKSDGAFIPMDETNTDYQEYLKRKAIDGNEPEAAD